MNDKTNDETMTDLDRQSCGVIRDEDGIPVEWTLLRLGTNPIMQDGVPGSIDLTREGMESILRYFREKGERIPVDSRHYLYELSVRKGLDEADVLRLLPSKTAAMGFGSLFEKDGLLRFRVQWNELAKTLLREKIFRYFSPVIRGLTNGPLRITSVAMENEPAINGLDELAASARTGSPRTTPTQQGKEKIMEEKQKGPAVADDGKDQEAVNPPESELVREIRHSLGLGDEAGEDVLLLAFKTMMEKATEADRLREELEKVRAEAAALRGKEEDRKKKDLLDQGVREGKITPATRPWWEKLDCVQLSAHLPQAPVLIRQGAMERSTLEPDTGALTPEDRAACRLFGFSEEEFLRFRDRMN